MTIQIKEILDSRNIGSSAEGLSGSREFICYDDDGSAASLVDVIDHSDMPTVGDSHPDISGIWASTFNMTPSRDRAGVWVVKWEYNTTRGGGGPDPQEPPGGKLDVSVGLTIVDLYKSGPDFPPNINSPVKDADIGGVLEAEKGYPLSYSLPTAQITIAETINTNEVNAGALIINVGKRNLRSFIGFPAGTVLYAGTDVSRAEAGVYRITHRFHYDAWFHLRQVPERDVNGRPVVKKDDDTMEAYWRQPFKHVTDFGWLPSV